MMSPLPQAMLAATCAPDGIGNEPSPVKLTVLAASDGLAEGAALCVGGSVGWCDAGDVGAFGGLALVMPALQAAVRPTVQVARVNAARRYMVMGCPSIRGIAGSSTLG